MLYWTDWSIITPAIYRSSVVNPAREMLISGNLTWPNALAIDFTGNDLHDTGIQSRLNVLGGPGPGPSGPIG